MAPRRATETGTRTPPQSSPNVSSLSTPSLSGRGRRPEEDATYQPYSTSLSGAQQRVAETERERCLLPLAAAGPPGPPAPLAGGRWQRRLPFASALTAAAPCGRCMCSRRRPGPYGNDCRERAAAAAAGSLDQEIRAGTGDWRRGRRASQPAAAPGPREPRADARSSRAPGAVRLAAAAAATATHARTHTRTPPAQAPGCPELVRAARRGERRAEAAAPPTPPPAHTPLADHSPSCPLLAAHPALPQPPVWVLCGRLRSLLPSPLLSAPHPLPSRTLPSSSLPSSAAPALFSARRLGLHCCCSPGRWVGWLVGRRLCKL